MAGSSTGFTCEKGKVARVTATDVVWVGIDAGKASHHAVAVDAGGKRLWSVKVANGQQPVEELIGRAAKTAGSGEARWAVDLVSPAAALLIAILLSSVQKVVYVPGRVVHGMAAVFRGEGKTDAKDARVIRRHRPEGRRPRRADRHRRAGGRAGPPDVLPGRRDDRLGPRH